MEKSKKLIERYLLGECNEQERALVESWYTQTADSLDTEGKDDDLSAIEMEIWKSIQPRQPFLLRYQKQFSIAATLLLICSIAFIALQFQYKNEDTVLFSSKKANTEIVSGRNKAILTLSNGKKISLDTMILNPKNGAVNLNTFISNMSKEDQELGGLSNPSHKIDIPKGGEFQFVLSDGTQVWLNSESSFTFPSRFNESERVVRLNGEGYFEVAKLKNKPFKVVANETEIKVLGTHFNISSYKEEQKTVVTLAEGSVRVSNRNSTVILKPNQAAEASENSNEIKIENANVAEVLAWKEGFFVFDNSSIQHIMKTLSRWYDFEIEYKGSVTTKKFGGTFSRSKNIKDLLASIESFGTVHFKIEGKKVTVMP